MQVLHYYGDTVRKLFIAAGVLMALTLPLLREFIPYPLFVSIAAIISIAFLAGVLAPRFRWTIYLDGVVAAGAVMVFEYYAVNAYTDGNYEFFLVNQSLAIIFFLAFYYATKTVRGATTRARERAKGVDKMMQESIKGTDEIVAAKYDEKKKRDPGGEWDG